MISMKTLKLFFVIAGIVLSSFTFSSCLDDDGYSLGDMWYSVATARPLGDDSFYFTLDGGTTLFRAAGDYYGRYYPKTPQRVQINYTILGDNYSGYDHAIKLNRLDTILTKPVAEHLGLQNDSIYGTDPVGIEEMWVGDGYLNVIFKFNLSNESKKHFINLVKNENESESPYELEFRHNAYEDYPAYGGRGIVAFDLAGLPDTEGQDVTLKIKVKTFDGEQTFEKKYNSGKNTEKEPELTMNSFENTLK